MKIPLFYFNWLQKNNPTGAVDTFPELKHGFETSVPGLYCIGDLTGIPLIKLAAESGYDLIHQLHADPSFKKQVEGKTDTNIYDIIIVGAGPSGISAGIHAHDLGYTLLIIESSRLFNTILNFPKGKPIYVTPAEPPMKSVLKFSDGTKETLLDELNTVISKRELPVHENEMVQQIIKEPDRFTVKTVKASYKALRVIVAIGKTGNSRTLGVPGEKLPKVFTRLIDPGEYHDKAILVVGGGDSALETANALAETGSRVTLSYRKESLARPKEHNLIAFNEMVHQGKIVPFFKSSIKEIRESDIVLTTEAGEKTIPNDAVYACIGTELPIQFFKRSHIRMQGEKRFPDYVQWAALLLFSFVLYFGKSGVVTKISSMKDFFTLPAAFLSMPWPALMKGFLAWISFSGMIVTGVYLLIHLLKNHKTYFTSAWNRFKYSYYGLTFLLFGYLYILHNLQDSKLLGHDTGVWYTIMYSITIVVFGIRRMYVKPTAYIKKQTISLMLFQVIPLFLLPVYILPWLGNAGLLGDWITTNVFPGNSYWRAYGFILAWPLFIGNLASGQPVIFWLIISIIQTFLIIPWINYKWGKGAYCGWICSCGALAETLGDEYRDRAFHGPKAKKWDNAGQVVLWFATLISLLIIMKTWFAIDIRLSDSLHELYIIFVDIFLAGVIGVGAYFFLSGRVWCRFFCPLAALMHIYTRFSIYRIFSNKKRCISCNICTKVCHMGIDVMGYANRGIPMDDVQCVRCSACITNCPMDVLSFGSVKKSRG